MLFFLNKNIIDIIIYIYENIFAFVNAVHNKSNIINSSLIVLKPFINVYVLFEDFNFNLL